MIDILWNPNNEQSQSYNSFSLSKLNECRRTSGERTLFYFIDAKEFAIAFRTVIFFFFFQIVDA